VRWSDQLDMGWQSRVSKSAQVVVYLVSERCTNTRHLDAFLTPMLFVQPRVEFVCFYQVLSISMCMLLFSLLNTLAPQRRFQCCANKCRASCI
jgi:hypothetical protein